MSVEASRIVLGVALALTVGMTGCSAEDPTDPYAADVAQMLSADLSEFEREVFADGEITRAEYEEAHQLWLLCMEEAFPPGGPQQVDLILGDDSLYQYRAMGFTIDDEAYYDTIADSCSEGTIDNTGPLYAAIARNPERKPFEELVVECLVRNNVVEANYTVDNFLADTSEASQGSVTEVYDTQTGETTLVTEPPEEVDSDLLTGLDVASVDVENCFLNPQQ